MKSVNQEAVEQDPQQLHEDLHDIWGNPKGLKALTIVNHTTLGLRFMITGMVFFLIGGILAMLVRTQLAMPDQDFMSPEIYNQVTTMHGTVMMFLFAVPMVEAAGVLLLPQILAAWDELDDTERFLFNKLITGGFRIGISQKLMTRALSRATGKPEPELAHRLMGNWHPDDTTWHGLVEAEDASADASRPYPFYLAYGLEAEPQELGDPQDWRAEWKWDGIRGQLILRDGAYFVWSRGEELMTDRFPELARAVDFMPDGTVLDGELLVWPDGQPAPSSFNALQARIGRKTVPKKLLAEAPVVLHAYDLLEWQGQDIRPRPFAERRALLEQACAALPDDAPIRLSPQLTFPTWDALADQRATARQAQAEGVMLKRADSPYLAGRKKGDWWKWKLDPLTIDAVMIYAQSGSGRRANLFTDFTFAVWNGNDLVPFTKAYSGLTDAEFRKITAWVRKNTLERFGPVRKVTPHHVFEIAFEGIQRSTRHKSGVALRFPRMLRWRQDKPLQEANTLADLEEMLRIYG